MQHLHTRLAWGPSLAGLGCQCPALSFASVSYFTVLVVVAALVSFLPCHYGCLIMIVKVTDWSWKGKHKMCKYNEQWTGGQ